MALAPLPDVEPVPSPADEEEDQGDRTAKMTFLEHLDELRKRLIICAVAVAAGFAICLAFSARIYAFIMEPVRRTLPAGGTFIYTEPMETFMLYMKVAALAGVVVAAPVVLWQIWLFVAPGLYSHEKRFAIPFVLFSTIFFVAGALFSHYVAFPWAWAFFASFATDYIRFMPKVSPAFSLYAKMLLAFGLIFQMPTLVFFLARVGAISARFLLRNFKYAVLVIFIIAAALSPGTDIVSQALMAGPMLVLYVISIVIAWVFAKKPHVDR
ncbi:MAG TPA: twin-arginine translocase subunit TatC [Vicinamibacterales bacterium]|nr:twin-arginine translocase subunit TatC [Vicinamibacterales bacterium]